MTNRNRGWGHTFNALDSFLRGKFLKDTGISEENFKYSYNNFYPFKSKSGRWYAFYNKSYSDVAIVSLEKDAPVVVTNVYSNKEPRVYAEHTNSSTYVPAYIPHVEDYVGEPGSKLCYSTTDHEIDEELEENDKTLQALEEKLVFAPFAFNAFTYWAADFEFYVDIIDLRDIDDGKVNIFNTSFTVSRAMLNIRDFVKCEAEVYFPFKATTESEEDFKKRKAKHYENPEFIIDFELLVKEQGRFSSNNLYNFANGNSDKPVQLKPELPWQTLYNTKSNVS